MEELYKEIFSRLEDELDGSGGKYRAEEVEKAINMALIFAHNLCTQISDKYNKDDFITEATVAAECCVSIIQFVKVN